MKSIKTSILCLLGAVGIQGMEVNVDSKISTKTGAHQMADMLSGSELDLKNFLYIKTKHKKSGEADEEYVQEDEDNDDDEEEKDDKPPSNTMTLVGRDKDGKFKHHENYLQLKDKINEQEKSHQKMFDTINEKLNDQTFLQQAMNIKGGDDTKDAAAGAATTAEAISTSSSKAPDGMTEADEKCYETRFADLGKMKGRQHYQDIGSDQGRLPWCAQNLTDYMTQRYIDNNPDLQHAFGRKGRASKAQAHDHYTDFGDKEKRDISLPPWDVIFNCGDTSDPDQEARCKCGGVMHMGLLNAPDSGNKLDTFEKMRQWKTWEKRTNGDRHTACSNKDMGVKKKDLDKDADYQCWCERKPKFVASKCADYGNDCLCNGLVFQMVKEGADGAANFYDAFNGDYTVNNANNTKSIKCSKKNFEGINVSPGKDKVCWCDENQQLMADDGVQTVKKYWRSQKAKLEEQEAIILAKKKAADGKAGAIAAEKKATADLKATVEDNKAKKAKLIADKEAALAKAEADAKTALEVALKLKEKQAEEAKKRAEAAKKKREEAAKKKENAEKRRAAALKEKREEEKQKLLDEIEKDKEEAVEEAVEAALEEQRAAHLAEIAEMKEKEEQKRVKVELERKMKEVEEQAEAAEAARAAEEARDKELEAEAVANAEHRAQVEAAAAAAHEKALADEIAEMENAYKAKLEAEKALRQKLAAERASDEAELLAQREKAAADAAAAKKAAAEAEVAKKAELAAAEASLKKEEEEEHQKEMELEKEAYASAKEEQEAAHKLLKAQKDAELSSSQADRDAAEKAAAVAKKALEDAKAAKKAALEKKKALKKDIEEKKEAISRLNEEAAEALTKAKKAAEREAEWKEKATAFKADAVAKMAAAEKKANEHEQELKAELARIDAEHAQALKGQERAFKEAAEAQARAHAAAEAARKRREEEQLASHKRQLAARKAHFEGIHSATWSEATTGISMLQINVEDKTRADDLIKELFYDYLVADILELNLHMLVRTWVMDGKERIWFNQNQLTMITTDDKISLIKAEIENFKLAEPDDVPFDLVVVPIATGGKDYIEWVHQQTSYVRESSTSSGTTVTAED